MNKVWFILLNVVLRTTISGFSTEFAGRKRASKNELFGAHVEFQGLGGSRLEVRTHKSVPGFLCSKGNSKWKPLWISIIEIIPFLRTKCFLHSFGINFEKERGYYNNEGVEHRIIDYGGTSGIESLNPYVKSLTEYFQSFVKHFVDKVGYTRGKNIRAAPYDWRQGPDEWFDHDFPKLKELVEDTYTNNNNRKVVLLGHSLGGPYAQLFLSFYVSKNWKQKYIKRFIDVAGSHDGAIEPLDVLLTGYYFILPVNLKSVVKRFGGILMTIPRIFHQNETVLYTKQRNYNMSDFKELLLDMGDEMAANAFEHLLKFDQTADPGIDTTCIFGSGIKTPKSYSLEGDVVNTKKMKVFETFDSGDGTIDPSTWKICESWENTEVVLIDGKDYSKKGINFHRYIITDDQVLRIIERILFS